MMAGLLTLPGQFYIQSISCFTSPKLDKNTLTSVAFVCIYVAHATFDLCMYALLLLSA